MSEAFVLFQVDKTLYAVPAALVVEVEMINQITPVPNAPEFVEGIVYVRGQVVPVVSLRKRFHLEPVPFDLRSRLVVVNLEERMLAIVVDTAREFIKIDAGQINPPPEEVIRPGVEYLTGVVKFPDRLVMIVDLRKMLSNEEQAQGIDWATDLQDQNGGEHV